MRVLAALLALLPLALLAGCLDDDAAVGPADVGAAAWLPPVPEDCEHAGGNTMGTTVNDYYLVGGSVWHESNGISGLQQEATCEGPADERVAG
jgi:hypothetical protein